MLIFLRSFVVGGKSNFDFFKGGDLEKKLGNSDLDDNTGCDYYCVFGCVIELCESKRFML